MHSYSAGGSVSRDSISRQMPRRVGDVSEIGGFHVAFACIGKSYSEHRGGRAAHSCTYSIDDKPVGDRAVTVLTLYQLLNDGGPLADRHRT